MDGQTWDLVRVAEIRAGMKDAEIEALRERSQIALESLTLDEVGVLFLVARERIRELEANAKRPDSGEDGSD